MVEKLAKSFLLNSPAGWREWDSTYLEDFKLLEGKDFVFVISVSLFEGHRPAGLKVNLLCSNIPVDLFSRPACFFFPT